MDLLQAVENDPYKRINLINETDGSSVITGVIPADFDGDSFMDLLITKQTKGKSDDPVQVQIFWGRDAFPGIGNADFILLVLCNTFDLIRIS